MLPQPRPLLKGCKLKPCCFNWPSPEGKQFSIYKGRAGLIPQLAVCLLASVGAVRPQVLGASLSVSLVLTLLDVSTACDPASQLLPLPLASSSQWPFRALLSSSVSWPHEDVVQSLCLQTFSVSDLSDGPDWALTYTFFKAWLLSSAPGIFLMAGRPDPDYSWESWTHPFPSPGCLASSSLFPSLVFLVPPLPLLSPWLPSRGCCIFCHVPHLHSFPSLPSSATTVLSCRTESWLRSSLTQKPPFSPFERGQAVREDGACWIHREGRSEQDRMCVKCRAHSLVCKRQ